MWDWARIGYESVLLYQAQIGKTEEEEEVLEEEGGADLPGGAEEEDVEDNNVEALPIGEGPCVICSISSVAHSLLPISIAS